jgi:hypothetical protein
MAIPRGRERAPSHNAYRGTVGATRHSSVLVTLPGGEIVAAKVCIAVDVVADPELGQRLLADVPDRGLNVVRSGDGSAVIVNVPVVYHDPANEIFALVLPEGDRHRELDARGVLYAELAKETQAPVPAYVRDFAVVFGAGGLGAHLETLAERSLGEQRAADSARDVERERAGVERKRGELTAREQEVERRASELERRANELERRASELDRRTREMDRRAAEIDVATAELDKKLADADRVRGEMERTRAEMDRARLELERERRQRPAEDNRGEQTDETSAVHIDPSAALTPTPTPLPMPTAMPVLVPMPMPPPAAPTARADSEIPTRPLAAIGDADADVDHTPLPPPQPPLETSPFELLDSNDAPILPISADPITTTTADGPLGNGDAWSEGFANSDRPASIVMEDGRIRVGVRVSAASAAALTASPLDVRLVAFRQPEYPVIALVVGTPAALRGLGPPHRVVVPLDIASDGDRRALQQLGRDFAFELDVLVDRRRLRRARLRAPLAENVGYIMRAVGDHLRAVPAAQASFARAVAAVTAPGFDLLGMEHPEHGELRVDKLESLSTANQVRRALAMARRFIKPAREDYLVTVRGFPLVRWRELRTSVLTRAVAMGLWMGPELAQTAVSEGLARSRKDLIGKLEQGFAGLLADAVANDLDPDAIEDNRKAIADEAQSLGVAAGGAVASENEPVVSGTIAPRTAPAAASSGSARGRTVPELLGLLEDKTRRVEAALELCERGDPSAARPIMNAVRRMGRSEAVRVLGAMVKLGPGAAPTLTAGLSSSKAFLRHGCALALALLRTEAGTEAVVDALLAEPTEIWREIARAVGHIGPAALMPLAARLGRLGDRAGAGEKERIAWAMAHVGVRGGKAAVATLAAGQSAVAPVAAMALERLEPAASDDVHGRGPAREVTVNRAFSRRFFEALERGLPDVAAGELEALDASTPMELLDEDDLIDELDESTDDDGGSEAELDESDLLPG